MPLSRFTSKAARAAALFVAALAALDATAIVVVQACSPSSALLRASADLPGARIYWILLTLDVIVMVVAFILGSRAADISWLADMLSRLSARGAVSNLSRVRAFAFTAQLTDASKGVVRTASFCSDWFPLREDRWSLEVAETRVGPLNAAVEHVIYWRGVVRSRAIRAARFDQVVVGHDEDRVWRVVRTGRRLPLPVVTVHPDRAAADAQVARELSPAGET